MKTINLAVLWFALLLNACGQMEVRKKLLNEVKHKCEASHECFISLKDVTKFEWDKVYIFNSPSDPEIIREALKGDYHLWRDLTWGLIVFVKGENIIHKEYEFYDPEKPVKLDFEFNGKKYLIFTPADAHFEARKWLSGKDIYILTPIEK